jgi:nicotinamide riboside kinase
LAAALARHFRAEWVPEFARTYLAGKSAPLTAADVEPIARGQQAAQDEAAARAGPLLVLDTDLVSTLVYARHYYGSCPAWIEAAARSGRADLYLLHHPDVPWIADGPHRDAPATRAKVLADFRAVLAGLSARTVEVHGSWAERERAAMDAVARLLALD